MKRNERITTRGNKYINPYQILQEYKLAHEECLLTVVSFNVYSFMAL